MVLLIALLGCSGAPSSSPKPSTGWRGEMLSAGAGHAIELDHTDALWALPASTLPADWQPQERYDLSAQLIKVTPPAKAKRSGRLHFEATLPFELPIDNKRMKPVGLEVLVDDKPAYFIGNTMPRGRTSWRIIDANHIHIVSDVVPKSVVVLHPGLAHQIARLDPGLSGLSDRDYTRTSQTLGNVTRAGLLLPAPSRGSWELTLPDAATLHLGVGRLASPVRGPKPDGATLSVVVRAQGEPEVVGSREVPPGVSTPQPWSVDLSKWSGQKVRLSLVVDPKEDAVMDLVFVSAPDITGTPTAPVRRVLVIGLDTTRYDRFGIHGYQRPTTPNLDAFGARSVIFDRAFNPAPRTRPSFRTATTGRWPLQAVGATNIGEVFADNGWATVAYVANIHLTRRFGFPTGYDLWSLDPRAKAKQQVDRALGWFAEHPDRDTFMFLHIMDPHLFYNPPPRFREKLAPNVAKMPRQFNRWDVYAWDRRGKLSDERKQSIANLYDGEVAFMDEQLGRLLHDFTALPGENLVIIHSDHGEELWDHGGFEHNHTLYNELTHAVLWVHPPGGQARRVTTPVSTADIAPTLFDFAGISERPPLDGKSLVPLLNAPASPDAGWDRPLPVAFAQYAEERWGVIWNDHKYILFTGSGEEELYSVSTDITEQHNLASSTDLAPYRQKLAEVHGIPVGPGWRIPIDLSDLGAPLRIALPAPALQADVLDPETQMRHRANLEWGESPKKTQADVGTVTLADDNRSLIFTPGPVAKGTLYVLFDSAQDPAAAALSTGGKALKLQPASEGMSWEDAQSFVHLLPGTVLVPPPGEAARMKALAGLDAGGSAAELKMLEELGYVGNHGAH